MLRLVNAKLKKQTDSNRERVIKTKQGKRQYNSVEIKRKRERV